MRLSYYILLALAIWQFLCQSCSCSDGASGGFFSFDKPEDLDAGVSFIDTYLADGMELTLWDTLGEMPDDECVRLQVDYPGGTLRQLFADSNSRHYAEAEKIGVEPLYEGEIAVPFNGELVRVKSDSNIYVDKLRYSYPYLVPEAKQLLDEIGHRFANELKRQGGGDYRLKVTSLLRTRQSVKRLRRVNAASVDSSAHLFGTTFDISFTYFPFTGGTPHRTQEDLKNLLATVLHRVRDEGKCYIIYERKRGCFHITVRS